MWSICRFFCFVYSLFLIVWILFFFGEFNLIQFGIESKIHLENSKKKNSNSLFRFNDLIQNHLIFIPFQTNHFNSCLSFSMFLFTGSILQTADKSILCEKKWLDLTIWKLNFKHYFLSLSLALLLMGTNKQIVVKFNLNKKKEITNDSFFFLLFIDSLIRVEIGFGEKKIQLSKFYNNNNNNWHYDWQFFFHFFLFCHLI